MAWARIVTTSGTVIKNVKMTGHSTWAVDAAASALSSIICNERDILHIEVDYTECNDSKTIEGIK